jgi:acyl carrier protein
MSTTPFEENCERIRRFLAGHIRNRSLAVDDDIFQKGFVDSLFALQLVMFLESEFAIRIEDADLDLANFRTMSAMSKLVSRKRGAPDGAP